MKLTHFSHVVGRDLAVRSTTHTPSAVHFSLWGASRYSAAAYIVRRAFAVGLCVTLAPALAPSGVWLGLRVTVR